MIGMAMDNRARINGRVTNNNTGTVHMAEIKDGKIVSILCCIEPSDIYEIGTENGKRMCRRCGASYSGSAHGYYDYSKTVW